MSCRQLTVPSGPKPGRVRRADSVDGQALHRHLVGDKNRHFYRQLHSDSDCSGPRGFFPVGLVTKRTLGNEHCEHDNHAADIDVFRTSGASKS